nr:hypothetical protein [uncultured Pedobacter sp.]
MKNYQKLVLLTSILPFMACQKTTLSVEKAQDGTAKDDLTTFSTTTTYYVDNVNGSDSYSGTTTQYPWKTLAKVNSVTFVAGNRIRFKSGGNWTGQLHPKGSGISGSTIKIDSYDTGSKPVINGNGVANGTVYLYNQQYWEINDLEITNFNASEEGGKSLANWESDNTNNYANVDHPGIVENSNSKKLGILIAAEDAGTVNHIYLHGLLIHGINGYMDNSSIYSRNNGGIYFEITGNTTPTHFNDILVDYCTVRDVDHTGMFLQSSWADRTAFSNNNWTPSTNIIVSHNTFENTGGHGLIMRVATAPLMEYNLFDHCSIKATGNAAFNFNTDDALWQYNESRFTKANDGDHDAGGIDADFRSKRTVIQYNYLHENDFGILVTGGDGVFNQSTVIRFNLFVKDGKHTHPHAGKFLIQINGHCTDLHVYNNTFDVGPSQDGVNILSFTPWAGTSDWPDGTKFYNNIFDNSGTNSNYNLGSSTNNTFDYNAFYKNTAANQPSQSHNIAGDVKFVNTGSGTPEGFKLKSGSVALSSGRVLSTNGGKDFFGNAVSTTNPINVGFYGGLGL